MTSQRHHEFYFPHDKVCCSHRARTVLEQVLFASPTAHRKSRDVSVKVNEGQKRVV